MLYEGTVSSSAWLWRASSLVSHKKTDSSCCASLTSGQAGLKNRSQALKGNICIDYIQCCCADILDKSVQAGVRVSWSQSQKSDSQALPFWKRFVLLLIVYKVCVRVCVYTWVYECMHACMNMCAIACRGQRLWMPCSWSCRWLWAAMFSSVRIRSQVLCKSSMSSPAWWRHFLLIPSRTLSYRVVPFNLRMVLTTSINSV